MPRFFNHSKIRKQTSSILKHKQQPQKKPKVKIINLILLTTIPSTLFLFFIILHSYRNNEIASSLLAQERKTDSNHHYSHLTIVMPSVVNPKNRKNRLKAISDTWGPSANAIFITHEEHEDSINSNKTSFPKYLRIPNSIPESEGVKRLQYIIKFLSNQKEPTIDFAFFVNDHTFVLPHHLHSFLNTLDSSDFYYGGHALQNKEFLFHSGASGYILSRTTLQALSHAFDSQEECNSKANNWINGNPGLALSKCIFELALDAQNVQGLDTRDSSLQHRFHAFGLVRIVFGAVDDWYINYHKRLPWLKRLSYDDLAKEVLVPSGTQCCSNETISFHYVEELETRVLYKLLQKLKQCELRDDYELKDYMMKNWPKKPKELGGYAHGLPNQMDKDGWILLISVLRKISDSGLCLHN